MFIPQQGRDYYILGDVPDYCLDSGILSFRSSSLQNWINGLLGGGPRSLSDFLVLVLSYLWMLGE